MIGDTTTTMMWIEGVAPVDVLHAYTGAGIALLICGLAAARQQHAYSPITKEIRRRPRIDWVRVGIVVTMLVAAIAAMVTVTRFPGSAERVPAIGIAVWTVVLLSMRLRRPDWELLGEASRGAIFLLALVLAASMMPVEKLPSLHGRPRWAWGSCLQSSTTSR